MFHNGFYPVEPSVAPQRQTAKAVMLSAGWIYCAVPQILDPSLRSWSNVAAWWRRGQQNSESRDRSGHPWVLSESFSLHKNLRDSQILPLPMQMHRIGFPVLFKHVVLLLDLPSSPLLECCSCLMLYVPLQGSRDAVWLHESLSNKSPFPGNERP